MSYQRAIHLDIKTVEARERAKQMEIKACFDIELKGNTWGKNGNWFFPCCAGNRKYVVRDNIAMKKFEKLDTFFDDTDEALSVSIKLLFLAYFNMMLCLEDCCL